MSAARPTAIRVREAPAARPSRRRYDDVSGGAYEGPWVRRSTRANHRFITARIRFNGLDTSHFAHRREPAAKFGTEAALRVLVAESTSLAQVLAKLGLPMEGRPHHELACHLRSLAIDTSHFRGAAWARGETKDSNASIRRVWAHNRLPDERVFVANSAPINGPALVKRLLALGWSYQCAWCALSEWRGRPLVLHVDHVNGVSNDNRLESLRLLCPNCHSQTDAYCNRKR